MGTSGGKNRKPGSITLKVFSRVMYGSPLWSSHFLKMSGMMHKVVGEFQEPNTSHAKQHEQDLTHTAISLIKYIIDNLRGGNLKRISFIDKVLEASKII